MKNIAINFVVIAMLVIMFTASVFPQKKENLHNGQMFMQEKMMDVECGRRPHISGNHDQELSLDEQLKQNNSLRIGEREIPFETPDGTTPREQQLSVIKNTLLKDFLVNDDTRGGTTPKAFPSIATDSIGNFVVVWDDYRNDTYDVYSQRYNSSGVAQGVNIKVNQDSRNPSYTRPSIAMDRSGNFVIVWQDFRNGDYINQNPDIYYQKFNSFGIAQGINTKVNDDAMTSDQYFPSVAMDESGNFVIVWKDHRNGNDDIYMQRYDSNGAAQSVNTKINDDIGNASQESPRIAMNDSGIFVIIWRDHRNGGDHIYYQRYNSNGVRQGANTKVNDDVGTPYHYYPSIALDENGNFVIVWEDGRNGYYNPDIYFHKFNSSGIAQGVNTKVNDDSGATYQYTPSVAMDGRGNFAIVWQNYLDENSDIYFQRYDSSGVARGINMKANEDEGNPSDARPSIALDGRGHFVIVWLYCEDVKYDNHYIYLQRYNSGGVAQGANTIVNNDAGTSNQVNPSIAMDGSGNFVIVWEDYRNNNHCPDIYLQRYNSSGVAQGENTKVNDDVGATRKYSPSIAMDRSGNFVIVWVGPDLYFQRYNSNGAAQGVNTRVYDYNRLLAQSYFGIAMDGSGNFVIVWVDSRNGNSDIYYQKYNADGDAQGENIKVNDDVGTTRQYSPSIAMDRSGYFVVVWQDGRNSNYDIYCQRYNSIGVTQGVNTKISDDAGTSDQGYPSIAMDGRGNYVIVWEDYRNSNPDIYYRRYNSNGSAQGINIKVNDDVGTASQLHPSIAMDESGFSVIVWEDYRYGSNNPDVIGQRYFPIGPFGTTNYRIVPDGPNHGERSPVVVTSKSQIVFSWEDNRRSKGWDIYAMIVRGDSVVSGKNIPTEFALLQNYPNPFNPQTKISFSVPKESYIILKVYDLLGREVATLIQEMKQRGEYTIQWSAEGMPCGVYFYRLVADDYFETKKMILMK